MKLARLASTPARSASVVCSWPSGASSVNSAVNRGVRAYPRRTPTLPPLPHVVPCCLSTESSGVIRPLTRLEENAAFTASSSAAPSPKYQEETRRLGSKLVVKNEGPAGGRLPVPAEGLLPKAPLP